MEKNRSEILLEIIAMELALARFARSDKNQEKYWEDLETIRAKLDSAYALVGLPSLW